MVTKNYAYMGSRHKINLHALFTAPAWRIIFLKNNWFHGFLPIVETEMYPAEEIVWFWWETSLNNLCTTSARFFLNLWPKKYAYMGSCHKINLPALLTSSATPRVALVLCILFLLKAWGNEKQRSKFISKCASAYYYYKYNIEC